MATPNGWLLVPVANPETTDRLLDRALDLAHDRGLGIHGMHVVEVPPQVPLSEGEQVVEGDQPRRLLKRVEERCADAGIEHRTRVRYARDIADGIVSAVDEHQVDHLLMGWHGRPRRRDIILGSFLDTVLGAANCDVIVTRIRAPEGAIESILVPVGRGPHSDFAVDVAGSIARTHGARIHLLHVIESESSDEAVTEARELLSAAVERLEDAETTEDIQYHDSVVDAVLRVTEEVDMTVLGASEVSTIRKKLVGSVAEEVGRDASSRVILARRRPD